MKKKLNEIFDKATPEELDQFSDELNSPTLTDEVLISIKDKAFAKTKLRYNNKSPKTVWFRFGAIAACFALIVSAIIVVPRLIEDTMPPDDSGVVLPPNKIEYTPVIFDATVSPEQLNGSGLEFIVGGGGGGGGSAPPNFEFITSDFIVKARVVNNYPDVYYKLDVSSEYKPRAYRLIQMECLEIIRGKKVPQYFLYLIPESLFVDMSVYDSLLISMSQLGAENYVLKNEVKSQMESFDIPIFADYQEQPELGNIIAFSDGVFDESLWKTESWIYGYQFARLILDNPQQYGDIVVYRGDSESDVIENIKKRIDNQIAYYKVPTLVTLNFSTKEARDAVEYVKPFVNGVFSQTYQQYVGNNGQLVFRRFINGCQTEETVTIDLKTEKVTHYTIRYTSEDMSKIENIAVYLSDKATEYAEQLPTPPHTDPEGKEILRLNLYAWYVKINDKVYGVIKTTWKYMEQDNYYIQYYDDSYILYDMTESTAMDISRDDLVKIIGTRNVYTGEYGEAIEMPMG